MVPEKTIAEIQRIAQLVLKADLEKKVDFPVTFTFMLTLERLDRVLDSLSVLIHQGMWKHEHSIGLLLRSILSDFIPIAYMVKFSRLEELEGNLYSLYKSDIKKVESHIERFRKGGLVTEEEADRYRVNISQEDAMHKLVKDYCAEHEVKSFPSNGTIADTALSAQPASGLAKKIQQAYDLWFYFSKYEHIGWYSFDLTRRPDKRILESRLCDVLRIGVILLGMCVEMLKHADGLKDVQALLKQVYEKEPEDLTAI